MEVIISSYLICKGFNSINYTYVADITTLEIESSSAYNVKTYIILKKLKDE